MAKFIITKCVDAYANYRALVVADSGEEARKLAENDDNAYVWIADGVSEFDDVNFENIEPEAVADEYEFPVEPEPADDAVQVVGGDAALALLREAIEAWPQVGTDDEINGGDMVEWFGSFHAKAKDVLAGLPVAAVAVEAKPNCFALVIDDDDSCDLQLFATEAARDARLWDYAFERRGDGATLDEFKARFDDVADAMELCHCGWHTDEMAVEPVAPPADDKLVVVLEGGLVQCVVGTGSMVGRTVHIIDYDTDDADPNNLSDIGQDDGTVAEAYHSTVTVDPMGISLPESEGC